MIPSAPPGAGPADEPGAVEPPDAPAPPPSEQRASSASTRPARWRRWTAWTLFALGTLLLLVASFNVWVKRQALDTDAWVSASESFLADDTIRPALASYLVNELYEDVDVAGRIAGAAEGASDSGPLAQELGSVVASAGPLIEAALRDLSVNVVERLLASAQVQALWGEANRLAHTALVAVLEGKDVAGVSTVDGNVVLDLQPILVELGTKLGIDVEGADVPADFGQIVVLEDDQLSEAQAAVNAIRKLGTLLVLVVLGLFGLAIYLLRGQRRRMVIACATSMVLVGVILLAVRGIAGHAFAEALAANEITVEPIVAVWGIGTRLLADIATLLIAYGAIALVGAWLAGPSRPAVAIRRAAAPTCRDHPVALHVGVVGLLLIALLFAPSGRPSQIAGTLVLFGLILLGVEALRRQTVREFAGDRDGDAGDGGALAPSAAGSAS